MRLRTTVTLLAGLCSLACDAVSARTLTNHRPTPVPMGADGTTGPPNRPTVTVNDADDEVVSGTTGAAIQAAIDAAAVNATAGNKVAVVLQPGTTYTLSDPLTIPSNVILDGTGGSIAANPGDRPSLEMQSKPGGGRWGFAIALQDATNGGASEAGLYYVRVESGLNADRCVMVGPDSDDIYLYDNILVDEVTTADQSEVLVGTPGARPVMIEPLEGASNVWIDGNQFLHFSTGIKIREGDVSFVRVFANRFTQWRHYAISALRRDDDVLASHDIIIRNNRINPPKVTEGPRKPIDFQTQSELLEYPAKDSNSAVDQPIYKVYVENNLVFGVPGTYFDRFTNSQATADMITAHRVRSLIVRNNKLRNGGEVGINVSRGSYDALIQANSVERCDGCGVNVGAAATSTDGGMGITDADLEVDFVRVRDNSLRENNRNLNKDVQQQPGNNYDKSFPAFARSGVVVQNGDSVTVVNNVFRELSSFVDFYSSSSALRYSETKTRLDARVAAGEIPASSYTPTTVPSTTLQAISVKDVQDLSYSANDDSGLPDHCVLLDDYTTP